MFRNNDKNQIKIMNKNEYKKIYSREGRINAC